MSTQTIIEVALTTGILALIALACGLLLGFAAKKFAVKKDERIDRIVSCLAGANCGGCGYSGCEAYATAIVKDGVSPDKCAAAGAEANRKIAEIMGVEATESVPSVARILCSGNCEVSKRKYEYVGLDDCYSVGKLGNGPRECTFGCIGLGACVKACAFQALSVQDGVARVNEDRCRGCGRCVIVCPQHLIQLVPRTAPHWVACNSKDKGKDVRVLCQAGCIGCGICAKNCPSSAIALTDNVAKIDYSLCTGCGVCAEKCPRKVIRSVPGATTDETL